MIYKKTFKFFSKRKMFNNYFKFICNSFNFSLLNEKNSIISSEEKLDKFSFNEEKLIENLNQLIKKNESIEENEKSLKEFSQYFFSNMKNINVSSILKLMEELLNNNRNNNIRNKIFSIFEVVINKTEFIEELNNSEITLLIKTINSLKFDISNDRFCEIFDRITKNLTGKPSIWFRSFENQQFCEILFIYSMNLFGNIIIFEKFYENFINYFQDKMNIEQIVLSCFSLNNDSKYFKDKIVIFDNISKKVEENFHDLNKFHRNLYYYALQVDRNKKKSWHFIIKKWLKIL